MERTKERKTSLDSFKRFFHQERWKDTQKGPRAAIQCLLDAGVGQDALYRALSLISDALRAPGPKVGDPLPLDWDRLKYLSGPLRKLARDIGKVNKHEMFNPDKWLAIHIGKEDAGTAKAIAFLLIGLPNTLIYYACFLEKQLRMLGQARRRTSKSNIPLRDSLKALLWKVRHDTNGKLCARQIVELLSDFAPENNPSGKIFSEDQLGDLAHSTHQYKGRIFRDICGARDAR